LKLLINMINLDDCDFWCQTDGDQLEVDGGAGNRKTKFVWRVKKFSAIQAQVQKGELIASNSFSVISPEGVVTKWRLQLYPNGGESAKNGNLSVWLEVLETKARASYRILISDKNGKKMKILADSDGKGIVFDIREGWGHRDVLSIDQLKKKWLFDDVLTLVCEMSVLETFFDIKQNHRLQMIGDLEKAFKEKNSFDVTLNCGDTSFECNKFMLTTRSQVFRSMFKHDTKENQTNVVNIKDIDPKVLEEMLHYVHTGDSPNIKYFAKELLAAADFYQLDQLKNSCQEVLRETMDAKNSIELLILSEMYSAPKLKENALKFVSVNMTSVSSACDWRSQLAGFPSLQSDIIVSLMNNVSMDDTQRGV